MNIKISNIFFSLIISSVIILIAILGYSQTIKGNEVGQRFFLLIGGDFFRGGYIQFFTFFSFFWGVFDIFQQRDNVKKELKAFGFNLLPTGEKHVLVPKDVFGIKNKLSEFERKEKYILVDMVKKACTKFRSSKSLSELLEVISIQTEVNKEIAESRQSNIRYLAWAIPSIGFIGTVLGISKALQIANSGDMNKISASLGVAFDTTLLALLLSIVIMWYLHKLQQETDQIHAKIKEYVVEHLVNRIEV